MSADSTVEASLARLLLQATTTARLSAYLRTVDGHANLVDCFRDGLAAAEGRLADVRARLAAGDGDVPRVRVLEAFFATPKGVKVYGDALQAAINLRQPTLGTAVRADAATYAVAMLDEPGTAGGATLLGQIWRLFWETDAFFCLFLYRVRVRLVVHEIPVLPTILHRTCMALAQMNIGQTVIVEPGVIFLHGQVVIDGVVHVGKGTVIAPWVTLGRRGAPIGGPTVGEHTLIGTGAKVIGPIAVGDHAHIGANAVVLTDIAPYGIAVGAPATVVRSRINDPDVVEMRRSVQDAVNGKTARDP